jgi:hemolysin activation/secretion protein
MLRAFVDYAHVVPEDPDISEKTEDLLGMGVGVELHVLRYLSARVDYGVALKDVVLADGKLTEKGDDQVHFSVTLLY